MEGVHQPPIMEPARVQAPVYGGFFTTDKETVVPYVLPGELLAGGTDSALLEHSPDRVAAPCIHFGSCGGCHYQHATYPAQLALKQQVLASLLHEAGYTALPQIQTVSGPEWHYRSRIRLRIEVSPEGELRAGYSLRGSNDFLPVTMCPIAAPLLWRAVETILTLAETDPLVRGWMSIASEIELFTIPDVSRLQLQLFVRNADGAIRESSSFPGFCERLKAAIPQLEGAGALLDPELNRRARRRWQGTSWGAEGLSYPAAGRTYWLPRGAFFQVNRFLVDQLVAVVTAGSQGELAWDLYAGVGLFTRMLADTFSRVVAVEGAEAAIPSLTAAARAQKSILPVHSATLEFLERQELQRERPDLIVLDPPRAGLGAESVRILARIAAPRLIYVSCDPESLMLDLAHLAPIYGIETIHLVDLFPQTFHLETIVHLTRKNSCREQKQIPFGNDNKKAT